MSNKIGRNDQCPCGSGKKHKKCCINLNKKVELGNIEYTERENRSLNFIEATNSSQLLNFIVGLQLQPNNHGKNIRIEELAKHIATNLNNKPHGDIGLFKKYLDKEFSYDPKEDIPENLFCENIVFYGGNYTTFPGISTNAVEIFKNLTETIFTKRNDLPNEFKIHVYSGIILILELGEVLCEKFNIEGNIEGAKGKSKFDYTFNSIDTSFSQNAVNYICQTDNISPQIINDFIAPSDDPGFLSDDPNKNPLLYYPIVHFENNYYFALISNQVNSLNEFLIRMSNKYNCNQKLIELYHDKLWQECGKSCQRMGWMLTDINIPASNFQTIIKEYIFQFDGNKLAYICYVHNDIDNQYFSSKKIDLDKRINEVIGILKEDSVIRDYKFLTLVTFENMGRAMSIELSEPQKDEFRLTFPIHQFNLLCYSEKWDNLSLWKFAKSYKLFSQKIHAPLTDTLDIYSIYKAKNESFYLGDDLRPDFLQILPGDGSRFIKEAKGERNLHGILGKTNDGTNGFIPSVRYADYAPLYKPVNRLGYYAICIEIFDFPIWLVNHQAINKSMIMQIRNFVEAIAFWLYKLSPEVSSALNSAISKYLEINVIFDEDFFNHSLTKDIFEKTDNNPYSFSLNKNTLDFSIPTSKLKSFTGSNNHGEREIMRAILNSFNLIKDIDFSEKDIESYIDKCIPLGQAKMVLLSDSQNDPLIDNRWLIEPLYISDSETDILLDEIPLWVEKISEIPKNIDSENDKKELFNTATRLLLEALSSEIQIFDFESLLHILIKLHETLIWQRERNKTIIPAQILCFGNLERELKEILENDNKLVKTSLATRCLIEYISAQPTKGHTRASSDDIDRLLVLMYQIVNYGFLSDAIHFKLANPTVGKLNSGRIGISREFFDDKLKPFAEANIKEEITKYIENFDSRFEIADYPSEDESQQEESNEDNEIDSAFLKDWGISFLNIYKFCYSAYAICIENESSILSLKESDFIQQVAKKSGIDEMQIRAGIERFSITLRKEYLKAPGGFNDNDVFPWKYNREFSFTRRFIVKYYNEKGEMILVWGFRNAISAQKQLSHLLFEGKLNNGGKNIDKLLGAFRDRKGKNYRKTVKDFLKKDSNLIVIDYEVDISPKGHLKADKKYGDVDVLVYNSKKNIIYSIECKDTNKAKNIHEMKKEMDNYLGRDGQKGMIQKHVDRHDWLIKNTEQLQEFLNIKKAPKIVSVMLTSEIIPVTYIKAERLPLPIVSFPELKKEGIKVLDLANQKFKKIKKNK